MANLGPPPPGYPGAGGAIQITGLPGNVGLHPPEEQYIIGSNKRPFLGSGLFATCPMICSIRPGVESDILTPLQLINAQLTIECHIATAFVVFEFAVHGPQDEGGQAAIFLPKHREATVTEVYVENLKRKSIYATTIIPKIDAGRYSKQGIEDSSGYSNITEKNEPELFSLMFGNLENGESVSARLQWFQPLTFEHGQYKLDLPLEFPMEVYNGKLQEVMAVFCTINSGVPSPVNHSCTSHHLLVQESMPGRVILAADPNQLWENADFTIGYQVWTQAIVASLNVQPPVQNAPNDDGRGTFALSVSPPAPEAMDSFQKTVIYLIDRSGSMAGEPIKYARNALTTGLDVLVPEDEFAIIAYDHEQIMWSSMLRDATPENTRNAKQWMSETVTARGLTDILTPLQIALAMLENARGVPYVFLLTDGAVKDERQIAQYLQTNLAGGSETGRLIPRVSTFAIGPFCNHFFLKQLALIGRGQFDVAFRPQGIQIQMERMLEAASKPVLTDVSIVVKDIEGMEFYPFPVPDLFVGLPLLVSGKYVGVFPLEIDLVGRLPSGEAWNQSVQVTRGASIPLDKVFARQLLDYKTAAAWMNNDDQAMIQEVVNISMQYGIPSAHSTMIGFETNKEKYDEFQKKKKSGKKVNPAKYAIGGVAAVTIVGGVGLAIGFGDLGSSLANAPVMDVITGGIGDALEGVEDALGGAADAVGGLCGDCCGDVGDCFTDCFEGIGDCLADLGDCCETFCSCLGSIDF